ncbi:MAG: hypothetical protein OEV24_04370 [Cyclobacteriaceae bacterium]|nr:hypothetical protein [Cyclobacteriaceae bacterium]
MKRNTFLKTSLLGMGALIAGRDLLASSTRNPMQVNKRERMLQWLEGKSEPGYTPAAFFLHFDAEHKLGAAAAERHLEYFRYTDMDFVKIQYEQEYTPVDFLKKPTDWAKLSPKKLAFYEPQLEAVREIVRAAKKDALVIMTLYSPFMWAGHTATLPVLQRHMEEDPEAVKRGLEMLTESQMSFVNACIKIGVDGFYMSTQGSETGQFKDPQLFIDYVKPSDLVAMKEVSSTCPFNILHVCDYNAPYAGYDAVLDYPGQVVNVNPQLVDRLLSWQQISGMFKRPNMGGLDRHGILSSGTNEQIEEEVRRVLKNAPSQFILGADCTVPGDTDWGRLKHAINVAHRFAG